MSENTYTPQQREAIGSDDVSILVSAGAGSGKTFVMTERITRLITERKTTADRLLVVTFTNAAAAQMKKKIREALQKKAAEDPTGYIAGQVPLLEFSQISTVHAFCLSVIREYYQFAGIDPSFSVLPEDQADILLTEAVDDAFDEMYKNDPDALFASLVEDYSGRDEGNIKNTVKRACGFLLARTDPGGWLLRAAEDLERSARDDYVSSRALPFLRANLAMMLERAEGLFRRAYDISLGCSSPKRSELLDSYAADASELARTVREGSFAEICSAFSTHKVKNFPGQKTGEPDDILIDSLRSMAKDMVNKAVSYIGFNDEDYLALTAGTVIPAKVLSECIRKALAIYDGKKRASGRLDYSDLEHLCLRILEDPDALIAVRDRYTHIFVDEYQDTNDIQETIIEKLTEGRSLFTVGDIKQSIYSFRDAEPSLFAERRRRCEETGEGTLVQLPDNFRSASPLIDMVNELFSEVMTENEGGVDFSEKNESMKASSPRPSGGIPMVKTVVYDSEEEEESSSDKYREEAKYIARLTGELLRGDVPDEKTGQMRPMKPSDITILLRRTKDTMALIASELRHIGIPVDTGTESGFYDMAEIELMLNILRVTDNYENDIALASVMRSMVYGFDPDDLVRIRLWGTGNGIREFHQCARHYDRDDATGRKLGYMWSQIDSFTQWEQRVPVYELIEHIFEETDLFVLAGSLADGACRQDNLRTLRDLAMAFESGAVRGLGAFIRFADSAAALGRFKTSAKGPVQDAVKIMSVHASKGLEFDTVILGDCARAYNLKETEEAIIFDKQAGICMDLNENARHTKTETMEHRSAVFHASGRIASEEMRILYVALTRARRQLVMVGSLTARQYGRLCDALEGPGREFLGGNFLELIYRGLWKKPFASFETITAPVMSDPYGKEAGPEPAARGDIPAELREEIEQIMGYEYPHGSDLVIPTKLSVSALKDPEEGLEIGKDTLRRADPPSFASERGASGSAIGTMTHLILEKIDLDAAGKDIEGAIEGTIAMLISSGRLPENARQLVDTTSLVRFFSSGIGHRLVTADSVKREMEFIMRMKASEIKEAWRDSDSMVMIQGIIDCIFEKDSKTCLLDYKTDRNLTEERRFVLNTEYSRQVRSYMKAYRLLTGKDADEAYICYLSDGSFVSVPPEQEERPDE